MTISDDDSRVVFAETFDQVSPPGLPPGWSASVTGLGPAWHLVSGSPFSAPNAAFAPDPDGVSNTSLTSPSLPITSASAQLTFQHRYSLEEGFDGGVLEISLGNGPFTDILAAGGAFVSHGYDGTLSDLDNSPIPGRQAWTGTSLGSLATQVKLPAAAAGQSVRLRWRCASDASTSDTGWTLDTIAVLEPIDGATLAFSNVAPISVIDASPSSPYPSLINVSGVAGTVTKVTVTLRNLTHPFPDDLDVLLVGPGGETVLLMSDAGGGNSSALNDVTLTFDDSAAISLADQAQILSGTFKPTNYGSPDTFSVPAPVGPYGNSLAAFAGTNPNGVWRLFVVDDLKKNAGQLASGWSLAITRDPAVVPPSFSAAQFQPNQGFSTTLTGLAGKAYRVDASSNLVNWIELFTRTNVTGTLPFLDSAATTLHRRFYRATQTP